MNYKFNMKMIIQTEKHLQVTEKIGNRNRYTASQKHNVFLLKSFNKSHKMFSLLETL